MGEGEVLRETVCIVVKLNKRDSQDSKIIVTLGHNKRLKMGNIVYARLHYLSFIYVRTVPKVRPRCVTHQHVCCLNVNIKSKLTLN